MIVNEGLIDSTGRVPVENETPYTLVINSNVVPVYLKT